MTIGRVTAPRLNRSIIMGKFARSTLTRTPRGASPVRTVSTVPDTLTANGGQGFTRDVKSELFLLAVSNFVSEDTFYERADQRDARFLTLIHQATAEDPEWTANFLYWLRTEADMRSASVVGAVEYGRATMSEDFGWDLQGSGYTPRAVLDSVLQRADEPAEALAYWMGLYGRPTPRWFQRALGDAADRLYTPYATFKYDGIGQPVRFGDVVEMSTATTAKDRFKWQMDRKFGRAEGDYGSPMIGLRTWLDSLPIESRRSWVAGETTLGNLGFEGNGGSVANILRSAGMTWQSVAGWIQGPMDATVWEAVIPSMGYMALVRNLRNFDEAGVSDAIAEQVLARLTDPDEVLHSKQFPTAFLSAYNAVPSDRWKHGLSKALDLSTRNVPVFGGRTLVLVDTSWSMNKTFSKDGTLQRWDAAALFGIVYARANPDSDVVSYSGNGYNPGRPHVDAIRFPLVKGASTLRELDRFRREAYIGNGTDTAAAVRNFWDGHRRILLLTDEQADSSGGVFTGIPASVMKFTFNLAGHKAAHAASSPTHVSIGGLSDKAFSLMKVSEGRAQGNWPWSGPVA